MCVCVWGGELTLMCLLRMAEHENEVYLKVKAGINGDDVMIIHVF